MRAPFAGPWPLPAFLAALLLIFPSGAEGESKVYSYTDEQGTMHFTNMPSDPRFEPLPSVEPPRRFAGDDRSQPYEEMITEAALKHHVDPHLLRAVIKCESDFNHRAVSRAGAEGLMQLMPATARKVNVWNSFDARQNIEGGTRYLKYLLDSFGDRSLALAAYNAGEGAVRRHGGIPPYRETKNYVGAVLAQYDRYCELGAEGDPLTSADIQSFSNSEGVILFTNVPWKYGEERGWSREETQ